ncbi:MAG: Flap-structured DNA-binding and RNA-binding protein [Bathelium mastoideum]|nr:MAG: Flap-structured DNA-binding and RNA-binding protein [Bathelium mastoideum]
MSSIGHIAGNRNSTPETSNSSLRPPSNRTVSGGHHLRASADMGSFSAAPHIRGIRPSSEVYFNQNQGQGNQDDMEKAAQQWIADIDQYETTLEEMAAATLDQDFKDELSAIEQWFRVLSEAERTAALYALLQQTTQVQIRFFIQVLQQMAKSHPMSGVLSPANFGEKDPMSQKMSDAMSKLSVEGSRNSLGLGRPPPSPSAKRNSGLDASTINSMFPDAAAAIAKQKAEFTQHTGTAPTSNRNSAAIGDRTSYHGPSLSNSESTKKENHQAPPPSPWTSRGTDNQNASVRPKSSSGHQPMGQFTQPPPSAGLRSGRPSQLGNDGSVQNTTLNAAEPPNSGMSVFSPYAQSGNWASMVNTPMVSNFNQPQQQQQNPSQADMVANATAMKLAALSTVNNRIQLDDVRKYRRARSTEGQGSGAQQQLASPGMPGTGILMTNELGQILTPQQAAALQAQQLAAMQGRRSRPNSPGIAIQGAPGVSAMNFTSPQNNGFLTAYDAPNPMLNNQLAGLNLNQFAMGMGAGHEGYLSDHSEMNRGRSPRGRRGSSKPPEDPTDASLLQDIPNWLRSLRLHKYTDNLKDLKWTELVELDDAGLEKRGVNALGARRKMLKVFEQVKEARTEGKL